MDVDYIFADQALDEIHDVLSELPHGERKEIADEIIKFAEKIKSKYKNID